jgi:TolB-like protein
VAWLVVQAASIAFPTFEAPVWALRVFIFVVMLGFPIALVIAWAVEFTPEGLKLETAPTGNKRFFAVTGAIAALAVGWYFVGQPSYRADDPQAQSGPPSVAVLPFVNLSDERAQEFFSDGMTEELLNLLAKVPALKVAARTSVFEFKGKGGDVREIGRKLGVTHVVEGSVRRDGDTIRVTAQLIRVADGFHLWSETYERKLEGVFALQDEIAQRISGALLTTLGVAAATASRAPIPPEAYDDYLKARALYRTRHRIPDAVAHLKSAVARAPEFGAAWASLSLTYEVVTWYVTPEARAPFGDYAAEGQGAAERAAALDPDSAITRHALANIARMELRFLDAERLYRQAIEADPTYPDAREDLSELLIGVGRWEESLTEARALVALEPFVRAFWFRIGEVGILVGRPELVEEATVRMRVIDPTSRYSHHNDLLREILAGRIGPGGRSIDEALAERPDLDAETRLLFRWALRAPDTDDAAARRLAGDVGWVEFAALRGDADLFFGVFEPSQRGYGLDGLYHYLSQPFAGYLLADPRAKRLLKQYGLDAYWRATRWPSNCRPLGADDFECHAIATPRPEVAR